MGVRRNIVPWICVFLHNCKQCLRFNNTLSEDLQFTPGVPQGTKLGPIGFQILINDAAADAESEYWKYVDDLLLLKTALVLRKGIYRMTYMSFVGANFF